MPHLCTCILSFSAAVIPKLSQKLTDKLLLSMSNHNGFIQFNQQHLPISFMELSNPTGKYVYRIFIRLFNLFSRKGYIKVVGNTCAPGLIFPEIDLSATAKDVIPNKNDCGILVTNVLGNRDFKNATTIPADPFMVVYLDSALLNLQDYLNSFSSKYRVRAQKVLKNSQPITKQSLEELPPNEWIAKCGQLLNHSLQNKTVAIGQNLSELIHCYQKSLGMQYKVNGYFLEGQLVGFISFIVDENHVHATHLGIDENLPFHYSLYQRMMYDLIDYGIHHQMSTINIGRTATEIKSTVGAKPVENSFVIFSKNWLMKSLLKLYAKYIHRPSEYVLRNPFK